MKLKRKDLEDVNDDFSDFSLSSPATKIRRLDAELPPIMEEDEFDIPLGFGKLIPQENFANDLRKVRGPIIEELPVEPENEERAIVLFKPMNTSLLHSPSAFSLSVDSDLISGFKNQAPWSRHSNPLKPSKGEETQDDNEGPTKECMAVVPWVPSHYLPQGTDFSEPMEAEETGPTTMDIEEDSIVGLEQRPGNELNGPGVGEGLHQWQQHCMVPQPPENTSSPVVWFR